MVTTLELFVFLLKTNVYSKLLEKLGSVYGILEDRTDGPLKEYLILWKVGKKNIFSSKKARNHRKITMTRA